MRRSRTSSTPTSSGRCCPPDQQNSQPRTSVAQGFGGPFARWFVGGTINASFQCLDRHVENGRGDRTAYLWEGEPGDTRTITYAELLEQVCRFAYALRDLGVKKGDRVGIYIA